MTDAISGNTLVIDKSQKALYHAALSISSNYLTTLEAMAVELLAGTGISRQDALALLRPLIQGGVDNLANIGLPDSLTGPISRGDSSTVEKHLLAMESAPDSHRKLYKMMGLETLRLASEKGKMAPGSEALIRQLLANDD